LHFLGLSDKRDFLGLYYFGFAARSTG